MIFEWEEPKDESLIETPDGWKGGSVVHTGGNIFCRIWYTTGNDEYRYSVIYNNSGNGVGFEQHKYNEKDDFYQFDETVDSFHLDGDEEVTDRALAEKAKEMMENFER